MVHDAAGLHDKNKTEGNILVEELYYYHTNLYGHGWYETAYNYNGIQSATNRPQIGIKYTFSS